MVSLSLDAKSQNNNNIIHHILLSESAAHVTTESYVKKQSVRSRQDASFTTRLYFQKTAGVQIFKTTEELQIIINHFCSWASHTHT